MNAAKEFGGSWSVIKLDVVEAYLDSYTTALKNKGFEFFYIDAFAGSGDFRSKETGKLIKGSARRALDIDSPPFNRIILIEQDQNNVNSLIKLKSDYPDRNISIHKGDANTHLISICLEQDWKHKRRRGVVFLDPFGMEICHRALEAIAKTEALDVWWLFPAAGLYRNMPVDVAAWDADKRAAITRMLPNAKFENLYSPDRQGDFFREPPTKRERGIEQIKHSVKAALVEIFGNVLDPLDLKINNSVLFWLFFCTSSKDPRAIGVANSIAGHLIREA